MKKTAFIGSGTMGGALIQAACQVLSPQDIIITNRSRAKADALAAALGCTAEADNRSAVLQAECCFLCVKPQVLPQVAAELADSLRGKLVVSIAAGVTIQTIRQCLGGAAQETVILRLMPNTPVLLGKGMLALSGDGMAEETHFALVEELLQKAGRIERITEGQMDAFSAVAGCGPAFAYQLIEALADGGVMAGLPRGQAQSYAAQMMLGAATMVLETGKHPGQLKDEVCSPGGSTIAGVAALEERGFRAAGISAVMAAYQKNIALGACTASPKS
ncbi:MAG: pyrroline-5-carboxylate reductase [Oscillospiraceae bacterium]|nr:pyrroline-5-carboxylate reductase [Oscillospiraceae bacterium]